MARFRVSNQQRVSCTATVAVAEARAQLQLQGLHVWWRKAALGLGCRGGSGTEVPQQELVAKHRRELLVSGQLCCFH